jgi:hypothetical protein
MLLPALLLLYHSRLQAQQLMQDPVTSSSNANTADAVLNVDTSQHDATYIRTADTLKRAGSSYPAGPTDVVSTSSKQPPHAAADEEDPSGSKVKQLLQPISAATGQTPLVLSFEHLSVWAPINPKKAGWGKQAWRALTCRGGKEANPKRQILYDISGQVSHNIMSARGGACAKWLRHQVRNCADIGTDAS